MKTQKNLIMKPCSGMSLNNVSRQSISGRKDQVMSLNRHKRMTSTTNQHPIAIRLSSWICLLAMKRKNWSWKTLWARRLRSPRSEKDFEVILRPEIHPSSPHRNNIQQFNIMLTILVKIKNQTISFIRQSILTLSSMKWCVTSRSHLAHSPKQIISVVKITVILITIFPRWVTRLILALRDS